MFAHHLEISEHSLHSLSSISLPVEVRCCLPGCLTKAKMCDLPYSPLIGRSQKINSFNHPSQDAIVDARFSKVDVQT